MRSDAKGPRLWLRPERRNESGRVTHKSEFIIRDGNRQVSTGLGVRDRAEAEGRLSDYIREKHKPDRGTRAPEGILISDVISIYLTDVGGRQARPKELASRAERLLEFFGQRTLAEVSGNLCRDYVKHRKHPVAARRELEDLRAAIRHHHREGFCTVETKILLPEKPPARDRWLTRSEAARLLWAAWKKREVYSGSPTKKYTSRHIARFILVALYTGSRAGVICGAAISPTAGRGHIDLDAGVFYRKASGSRRTNKRAPAVALSGRLLAHLRRWVELGIAQKAIVEWRGQPISRVNKGFAAVAVEAGLPEVHPHVLRHTAATWGMQAGADVWKLANSLGMTVETLLENYGHFHPAFGKEAAEAVASRQTLPQASHNMTVNKS